MTMTTQDEIDAEEIAWQWFAESHPHEAYATWPERFWQFFHAKVPNVTREQMEAILAKTESENDTL